MEKERRFVDITPGVCGDNSHHYILQSPEAGMVEIDGVTYSWYGGCIMCVDKKLKELENVTEY